MKPQKNQILFTNPNKCLGCHSCEIACAVAHSDSGNLVASAMLQRPLYARIKVVAAGNVVMPMQCRQCDNAPCVTVCPTGACKHVDGMVQINEKNCVGCKLCVLVCPFGAMSVNPVGAHKYDSRTEQGVAQKCDLCVSWRAANGKEKTACVQACPTQAIQLVNLDKYTEELIRVRAKELAQSQQSTQQTFR